MLNPNSVVDAVASEQEGDNKAAGISAWPITAFAAFEKWAATSCLAAGSVCQKQTEAQCKMILRSF